MASDETIYSVTFGDHSSYQRTFFIKHTKSGKYINGKEYFLGEELKHSINVHYLDTSNGDQYVSGEVKINPVYGYLIKFDKDLNLVKYLKIVECSGTIGYKL